MSDINDIVSLCKRRGFIFSGSEIYGGMTGTYDYGPYGVELLLNIKRIWWNSLVYARDDIKGIDASIITNKLLWKYSGHESNFSDPLVECKKCGARMRQDKMKDPNKCDNCGSHELTEPRQYLLMMGLSVGPVANNEINAYQTQFSFDSSYPGNANSLKDINKESLLNIKNDDNTAVYEQLKSK